MHVLSNSAQMREDIMGWLIKEYPTSPAQGEEGGEVGEEKKKVGEEESRHEEQSDSAGCSAKEDEGQEHQEVDDTKPPSDPTKLTFHRCNPATTTPSALRPNLRSPQQNRAAIPTKSTRTKRPLDTN